ncbi:MAG: hypothetical protein WCZ18_10700, partial [Ottowia sp.]
MSGLAPCAKKMQFNMMAAQAGVRDGWIAGFLRLSGLRPASGVRSTLNAQRSTLNAQRSTLNAQRSTLNA